MSPAAQPSSVIAPVIAKFKALADPFRWEVVELLQQREMCVCDLCDRMHIAQSKLSFHLKILREAGLVSARQEGRWIYYSLNRAEFADLGRSLAPIGQGISHPAKRCVDNP